MKQICFVQGQLRRCRRLLWVSVNRIGERIGCVVTATSHNVRDQILVVISRVR